MLTTVPGTELEAKAADNKKGIAKNATLFSSSKSLRILKLLRIKDPAIRRFGRGFKHTSTHLVVCGSHRVNYKLNEPVLSIKIS
jgi:hypothetical protein